MTEVTREEYRRRNQLLVDALESGEIKQCRGQLGKGEARCCLGVARDIYMEATGATRKQAGLQSDGAPTLAVREWFGWDYSCPTLRLTEADMVELSKSFFADHTSRRCQADTLNDFSKWSFERIAKAFKRTFVEEENDD